MEALDQLAEQHEFLCFVVCVAGASAFSLGILMAHTIDDWRKKTASRWIEDITWAGIAGTTMALLVTFARSLTLQ